MKGWTPVLSACSSLDAYPLDSPGADDLENIKNYLDQHFPHFSEPTVRAIYKRAKSLKTMPYVIVYAVKPEAVEILHIYHGSQDWR